MTDTSQWLCDFFGNGNLLKLDRLLENVENAYPADLKAVLLPLYESATDAQWPIILPWCDAHRWVFFAAAETDRTTLELSNVLNARLGSADVIADRKVTLVPAQGATSLSETALLTHCPAGFIRIELLPTKQKDKPAKERVFAALKDVITLFRDRPSMVRTVKRPFGRILSDFILANSQKDEAASDALLQELKNNGALSRRNLMLLELQQAGKLEKWDTLLNHDSLADLIRGRIPTTLMRMLLKAYQQRYFIPNSHGYPQASSPADLRPQCLALHSLFTQMPFLSQDNADLGVWKTWATGVMLVGEVDLLNALPERLKSDWLSGLHSWASRPFNVVSPPATTAAASIPDSLQQLAAYLQASLTATQEEITSYAQTLHTLDPQLLEQAMAVPLLKTLIEEIRHLASPQIVGWDICFSQLCQSEVDSNSLVQLVALESENWPADSFHEAMLLQLLSSQVPPDAFPILRNVMPAFIEWLERHQFSLSSTTWLKWLDVLAMEQSVSQADIKLAAMATDRFLQGSVSQEMYQQSGAMLELIVERARSFRNLAALGELIELFLDAPVQDRATFTSLWLSVQSFVIGIWARLDPTTRTVMRNLATDVLGEGAERVFPAEQDNGTADAKDELPDLSEARVAIYSLTEGAARRAKRMLETLFVGIRVEISHAHTATNKLINQAKHADYFIFSAGSATHQAFYAVSAQRGNLIYPTGKGAGSMLNAFIAHVQQATVTVD
ncbi:protein DpdD [Brenneria populi subsp. brevivirga]|uniref:protein DpdD n=1 Tax=Brenneria populi TaxID=1505588 RepID=UPI002E1902C7|nr:protein DpdD [Brenneria populi subsp. brevivirga]